MTPTYSQKGRVRYRYYLCTKAHLRGWDTCPTKSVSAKKIEAFVVDKIRGIGREPELVARTAEEARKHLVARKTALEAEARQLRTELEKAHTDLRNTLKAVPSSGTPGRQVAGAREEAIESIEERLSIVTEELATLEKMRIVPAELQAALGAFDPIWAHLEPAEQARVMQLLIERIEFDGGTGNLAISFRPRGVRTLAEEVDP